MERDLTKPKKKWSLNHRQRLFVEKLFELGVPTEAYRAAGYKGTGHSAETGAWLLMTKSNVKLEIERRLSLIDSQVTTRLRNLTKLALTTLEAIIKDREKRLVWNKKKKIYIEEDKHMGASAGVRRQAISDLFGWVGLNPTQKIDIDARVKNKTLLEVIRAKKLLDRGRPKKQTSTPVVKTGRKGRPKLNINNEVETPILESEDEETESK